MARYDYRTDCRFAIGRATTIREVLGLFREFPKEFGKWGIKLAKTPNAVCVSSEWLDWDTEEPRSEERVYTKYKFSDFDNSF